MLSLTSCDGDTRNNPLLPDSNGYSPANNLYQPVLFSDEPVSRTFMIYIVGSDLETEAGFATKDIAQIMETDIDLEYNNVVIKTGGAKKWHNDFVSPDKTEIYDIVEGGIRKVWESPALNMAAPETLTHFLDFCYSNYQTDSYVLILWNHGAGPIMGFGNDELSGEEFSISEMVEAFESSPFGTDNKLEFIGFDACLMGSVEIAFAFRNYASYLISSQEIIPGWGWNYDFLSEIDPKMTTEGVAKKIIDMYFDFCEMAFSIRPDFKFDITLSCLNLENLSELEKGLNELYTKAGSLLDPTSFPTAALVRDNVKEFTAFSPTPLDLIDLRHLCNLMAELYPEEAQALSDSLNGVVVYNRANVPNADGVSLLFPYKQKELLDELSLFYTSFNFAADYSGFMQKFIDLLQDRPMIDWNISKDNYGQESKENFFVQLTSEQAETFASASYWVYRKPIGGVTYAPIFNSRDVTLDENGKLIAHYEGKTQRMLDPKFDDSFLLVMLEQEFADEYIRYYVPAVLRRGKGALGDEDDFKSVALHIQTDRDGKNAVFLSATPPSADNHSDFPAREIVDIYEYEQLTVHTLLGRKPTYNSDGSLKQFFKWEEDEGFVGISTTGDIKLDAETKDSIKIAQGEVDTTGKFEYFMVFEIKDVYGNIMSSNLIPIDFKLEGE